MNASFTFPRPQPPVPRPAPVTKLLSSQSPDLAGSRESNALRASILDTALELGIGSNSLVADWMFNNPLTEEIEEEVSPFVISVIFVFFVSRKPFLWTASERSLVHSSVRQGTVGGSSVRKTSTFQHLWCNHNLGERYTNLSIQSSRHQLDFLGVEKKLS